MFYIHNLCIYLFIFFLILELNLDYWYNLKTRVFLANLIKYCIKIMKINSILSSKYPIFYYLTNN
jgi:hypothetical protein